LAGKNGKALVEKMAGGNWRPVDDGSEVRTVEGLDIQTTVDINLQDVTESALLKHLKKHDADYGCAIVMEVQTGEIKAISNLSKNSNGNYRERYNFAVAGLTEPGSTFKLASMIALMEDANIELDDSVETGDGEYDYYDRTMRDHKPDGYGTLTIRDAFAKSSNIAVSKLVNQHFGTNPGKFVEYVRSMGLAEPTGFQMVGEGVPYIKDPSQNNWSGTTLPWMSIGYELKLTPLQTLAFYNAIANNGTMIRPIIVREVRKADRTKKHFETAVIREKICSEETLFKVREMLEEVVINGTANNINDADYRIAGKTGTARKVENGRYVRKYYTSFAGYFPADRPKYSCIVVIDNPKGYNQYGSDVAAPVFKEVADKVYSMDLYMHEEYPESFTVKRGIFPVIRAGRYSDLNRLCNDLGISNHIDTETEWVRAKIDQNSIAWSSNEAPENIIPDVTGMTLRDALYILENKGLEVQVSGIGRVKHQSLSPGAKVTRGGKIEIKLG
jgi:cell division protein FtsI (penicillin-binding protein 3)